jgi:uncharacterized delta-60 repeat protein
MRPMSGRARRATVLLALAAAAGFAFGASSASAAPGDLDPSFGRNGVVSTPIGSEARALALQQNGRIIAVGNLGEYGYTIEIDRFFRDGDIDPTFGNGGRVNVVDAGDGYVYAAAAGIDSQGRIVVAGTLSEYDSPRRIVVARVLPGGDLDTSFGDQGIVLLEPGSDVVARLEIRPDDSILVGGTVTRPRQNPALIVAQIDNQGELVSSYGDGGMAVVPLVNRGGVAAMDVDAQGRATLAEGWPGADRIIDVIRLTAGGELDASFSGDGRRGLDLGRKERVRTVAIGKRGRIFVGGSVAEREPRHTYRTNLALARLKSGGSLDRRFGRRGIVTTDMDRFDYASNLEPQTDGKIVVSAIGDRFSLGYPQEWVVLRYGQRGNLDDSFSGNGRAHPELYGSPPAMEMQPDGRILLLGWRWEDDADTDPYGFTLARLRNDGRPLGG